MKSKRKNTLIIVGILLGLFVIGFGGWLWFTRQAFPKTRGNVKLDGLVHPVEIIRDAYGVPHIYAETPEDLGRECTRHMVSGAFPTAGLRLHKLDDFLRD